MIGRSSSQWPIGSETSKFKTAGPAVSKPIWKLVAPRRVAKIGRNKTVLPARRPEQKTSAESGRKLKRSVGPIGIEAGRREISINLTSAGRPAGRSNPLNTIARHEHVRRAIRRESLSGGPT